MNQSQYLEMFYAEAYENHEELDRLFTILEKNKNDKKTLEAIFRIMHTLKGNAMGLGLDGIAELGHVMEDVFCYVKDNEIEISKEFFGHLFRANDKMSELINAIKTSENISYKGITAKIKMELERLQKSQGDVVEEDEQSTSQTEEVEASEEFDSANAESPEVFNESTLEEEGEVNTSELDNFEKEENAQISFSDQIQIPVRKLDALLNLMGEMIIEKDTIITQASQSERRSANKFSRLHRITSDMQYAVMDIRMIQVGVLFNKFHRIVRDVANIESKEVDLKLEGTEIEIDRNVLKSISDSLVHLIRNAIGHGLEKTVDRRKAGKSETGKLTLSAKNEKDSVIIEVTDDGKGIDPQVIKRKAIEKGMVSKEYAETLSDKDLIYMIFESGFSNADTVNEISGRGVGMDVVKRSTEAIGGKVQIETEVGKGSTFRLSLPSSMAVKAALLFKQNGQEYAVPLAFTEAVISLEPSKIHKMKNGLVADYQGHTMMTIFLEDLYQLSTLGDMHEKGAVSRSYHELSQREEKLNVIVLQYNEKYVGLVVDKLLQQKEIVEKTLSKPVDNVELFSGATLLGNGNVCLVLNVAAIMERLFRENFGMRRMKVSDQEVMHSLN